MKERRRFSGVAAFLRRTLREPRLLLTLIVGCATIISFGVTLAQWFEGERERPNLTADLIQKLSEHYGELSDRVMRQGAELLILHGVITALPKDASVSAAFAALSARLDALEKSHADIRDAIATDPIKSLAIPMLRRDVQAIADARQRDAISSDAAIARVYDLSKWFLGLMGTMTLAVIGLVIGNVRSAKEKSGKEKKDEAMAVGDGE